MVLSAETLVHIAERASQLGYTCKHTDAGNIVFSRLGGAWIFDDIQKVEAWLARIETGGQQ